MLILVTDLEPQLAALLDEIMDAPQITVAELTAAGVLPVPRQARALARAAVETQLPLPGAPA